MTVSLDFLPQTAFAFLLIFARVGSMAMALPGIGDRVGAIAIAPRFCLGAHPNPLPDRPRRSFRTFPSSLGAMIALVVGEVIVGLAIGLAVKLIATGLQVAGSTIAIQTGLGFAQNVDPAAGHPDHAFCQLLFRAVRDPDLRCGSAPFPADSHPRQLSAVSTRSFPAVR